MSDRNERLLHELKRVLDNLSADFGAQEEYLKGLGTFPNWDELALEFDDIASQILADNNPLHLSEKQRASIGQVDKILDSISGSINDNHWHSDTLEPAIWARIRGIARQARQDIEMLSP